MTTKIDGTLGADNVAPASVDVGDLKWTPPFTKEFVSSAQTITPAGALTIPHGLGAKPKLVKAYLVCTVATGNWAVGDEAFIQLDFEQANAALNIFGYICKRDATNLVIRFAQSGFFLIDPVTASYIAAATVTTNFKIVFEAWA